MNEQINEIMTAGDADVLFSANEKRAQIRYRKLMRFVHPDVDDSEEAKKAAVRLNSLWEDWQHKHGKKPTNDTTLSTPTPKHKTTKITSIGGYTLFSVGDLTGDWLEACKNPGTTASLDNQVINALRRLREITENSPVSSPYTIEETVIPQHDGMHTAVKFKTDMKTGWTIGDLKSAYPSGLDDRDVAWILKRLVFLGCAVEAAGLDADDIGSMVLYHPSGHTLGLCSVYGLAKTDDSSALRRIIKSFMPLIASHRSRAAKRLSAFAESCMLDSRPSMKTLLDEYDEVMLELFGPPSYHEMADPAARIS